MDLKYNISNMVQNVRIRVSFYIFYPIPHPFLYCVNTFTVNSK